ncbi:MAG: tRNA-dihydrouridine synthase family protein, partial [Eubacteriales bacterium]|nr:tRNA-dihydrouridine synthase family protein [Eubacteriales bacterium]
MFAGTRNNIFLAPMAGITDAAFRQIAIEQGAGFTYTEMVSAKGLQYGSKKTGTLLYPAANEDVFGVQLFSSDIAALKKSIELLSEKYQSRIAVFDINMGCPAPKITANGEGCALMKNMPLAAKIIQAAVESSRLPVTVKFRKGWDESCVNAVDFAKMAEQSGASAVTVHGRTRQQFYSGKSDNGIIAEVKNAVAIPVIGS